MKIVSWNVNSLRARFERVKEFLDTNNLLFYNGIFHEDELWYFETMLVAKHIICIDATTYFYNISNEFAITKNISKKNIMDYVTILNYIFYSIFEVDLQIRGCYFLQSSLANYN